MEDNYEPLNIPATVSDELVLEISYFNAPLIDRLKSYDTYFHFPNEEVLGPFTLITELESCEPIYGCNLFRWLFKRPLYWEITWTFHSIPRDT